MTINTRNTFKWKEQLYALFFLPYLSITTLQGITSSVHPLLPYSRWLCRRSPPICVLRSAGTNHRSDIFQICMHKFKHKCTARVGGSACVGTRDREAWPANRTKESNHCQCIVPQHVRIWLRAAVEAGPTTGIGTGTSCVWGYITHTTVWCRHWSTGTDICLYVRSGGSRWMTMTT